MIFKLKSKGHKNVTSLHKSTFEITKDAEIGPTADCIIGTGADSSMLNFPQEFKDKIANSNTKIKVILDTENGHDEINGYGHEDSGGRSTRMWSRRSAGPKGKEKKTKRYFRIQYQKKQLLKEQYILGKFQKWAHFIQPADKIYHFRL